MSFHFEPEGSSKNIKIDNLPVNNDENISFSSSSKQDPNNIGLGFFTDADNDQESSDDEDTPQNKHFMNFEESSDINEEYYNDTEEDTTLSPEELLKQKVEYLRKLKRFEKQGRYPTKNMSVEHRLEDIKAEYYGIESDIQAESGIEHCKHGVLFFVGLIESGNKAFNPLGAHLDGWQSSLTIEMETGSYDRLLEQVYNKYLSRVDADPLIKLVGSLALSGMMHHIKYKALESVKPSIDTKLNQRTDIKGPSIDTDELLRKLDGDCDSDICSLMSEDRKVNIPEPKKRGRPKKNKN